MYVLSRKDSILGPKTRRMLSPATKKRCRRPARARGGGMYGHKSEITCVIERLVANDIQTFIAVKNAEE